MAAGEAFKGFPAAAGHFFAVWCRQGGGKGSAGILYFHFAPEGSFVAAAFCRPDPDVLDAIRERIRVHPDRFLAMQAELARRSLVLDAADALKRMPRGFEDLKDDPVASALRLRSLLVRQDLPLEATSGPALVGAITGFAELALPLLRFGWDAVDEAARA